MPRLATQGFGLPRRGNAHRASRLVLCLCASLILLGISHWTRWHRRLVAAEATLAVPLPRLWHESLSGIHSWLVAWHARRRLDARLRRLEHEVLELRTRLAADRALALEDAHLRALLGLRRRLGEQAVVVPILHLPRNPYPPRMLLGEGRDAGLHSGLAVVDLHGLVGVLSLVRVHSALVRLIVARHTLVPVEDLRSHLLTFVEGTGRLHRLSLPFVPNGSDIRAGDLLVTSGVGGVYPSGYPVAVVSEVRTRPAYDFAHITARVLATPFHDQEVVVLKRPLRTTSQLAMRPRRVANPSSSRRGRYRP